MLNDIPNIHPELGIIYQVFFDTTQHMAMCVRMRAGPSQQADEGMCNIGRRHFPGSNSG